MHIAWCMSFEVCHTIYIQINLASWLPLQDTWSSYLKTILDVDKSDRASLQRRAALHDFVYMYFWVAASLPCCPPRRWWASLGWASL